MQVFTCLRYVFSFPTCRLTFIGTEATASPPCSDHDATSVSWTTVEHSEPPTLHTHARTHKKWFYFYFYFFIFTSKLSDLWMSTPLDVFLPWHTIVAACSSDAELNFHHHKQQKTKRHWLPHCLCLGCVTSLESSSRLRGLKIISSR